MPSTNIIWYRCPDTKQLVSGVSIDAIINGYHAQVVFLFETAQMIIVPINQGNHINLEVPVFYLIRFYHRVVIVRNLKPIANRVLYIYRCCFVRERSYNLSPRLLSRYRVLFDVSILFK